MRPRDRLTSVMNEPYERLRAVGGPDARVEVVFDGAGWTARVVAGRRKPAGVGQGDRLDDALRALAADLGVERWQP